eukprot:8510628-Karenia_brevis.AAC.1
MSFLSKVSEGLHEFLNKGSKGTPMKGGKRMKDEAVCKENVDPNVQIWVTETVQGALMFFGTEVAKKVDENQQEFAAYKDLTDRKLLELQTLNDQMRSEMMQLKIKVEGADKKVDDIKAGVSSSSQVGGHN